MVGSTISHAPPDYKCPFCATAAGAEPEYTAWRDAHVLVADLQKLVLEQPRPCAGDSAGAPREHLRAARRPGGPHCPHGAPRRQRHAPRVPLRRRDRAPEQRAGRRPGRLAPAHPRDPSSRGETTCAARASAGRMMPSAPATRCSCVKASLRSIRWMARHDGAEDQRRTSKQVPKPQLASSTRSPGRSARPSTTQATKESVRSEKRWCASMRVVDAMCPSTAHAARRRRQGAGCSRTRSRAPRSRRPRLTVAKASTAEAHPLRTSVSPPRAARLSPWPRHRWLQAATASHDALPHDRR